MLHCWGCKERLPNMRALSAHLRERQDCRDAVDEQQLAYAERERGGIERLVDDPTPISGIRQKIARRQS